MLFKLISKHFCVCPNLNLDQYIRNNSYLTFFRCFLEEVSTSNEWLVLHIEMMFWPSKTPQNGSKEIVL